MLYGDFSINDSIIIEELTENKDNEEWIANHVISLEKLLSKLPKIDVKPIHLHKFFNGVKLNVDLPNGIYKVYFNGEFLGSGIVNNNILKRDVIINE